MTGFVLQGHIYGFSQNTVVLASVTCLWSCIQSKHAAERQKRRRDAPQEDAGIAEVTQGTYALSSW